MKTVLMVLSMIGFLVAMTFLTGCGGGGGGAASAAPASRAADPSLTNPPAVNPGSPDNIVVTYKKLTRTTAPIAGWALKTYTATGACVVYQTRTYCWDDGLKTLTWVSGGFTYGPFTYTYFNIGGVVSNYGPCSGGCTASVLNIPRYISAPLEGNMQAGSVNSILTTGTPVTVNCSESGGILNCLDFVIDLNQAAI